MTTAIRTFTFKNDTSANITDWISQVRQLVTSAGLVSTGNVLIPDPSPSATDFGYSTFQFPDTLQSTTPIFVKLNFGNYLGLAYITVNVGSAVDASFNVTAPLIAGATGTLSGSNLENLKSYACYVDGTFSMVLGHTAREGRDNNNCLLSLVIDRARNSTGVAQSSGYLVETPQQTFGYGSPSSRSMYGPSSPAASNAFIPAMIPSITAVTTAEGPNVNVFRHYSMTPGVRPHVGMLTYLNSEFGALTPFSATVLGSAHTYMPMGYAMNYWSSNQVRDHCCAIRWE